MATAAMTPKDRPHVSFETDRGCAGRLVRIRFRGLVGRARTLRGQSGSNHDEKRDEVSHEQSRSIHSIVSTAAGHACQAGTKISVDSVYSETPLFNSRTAVTRGPCISWLGVLAGGCFLGEQEVVIKRVLCRLVKHLGSNFTCVGIL